MRRLAFFATSMVLFLFYIATGVLAQRPHFEDFEKQYTVPTDKVLRVNIDIDAAEVKLTKSPTEQKARVSISFTEHDFRANAAFDEKRNRLEIIFSKKNWWDSSDHDGHAEVLIELPPRVEIDLDAEIKAGAIDIDLGGLAMIGFNLNTMAGEVLVDFSEPNSTVMDFLQINTKVGETELLRLGNARFKDAEINGGIGEMRVDFRGAMLANAAAHIDLDLGETHLHMPEEVGVKLSVSKFLFLSNLELPNDFEKSGAYYLSRNYDQTEKELFVKVSPGMGELRID